MHSCWLCLSICHSKNFNYWGLYISKAREICQWGKETRLKPYLFSCSLYVWEESICFYLNPEYKKQLSLGISCRIYRWQHVREFFLTVTEHMNWFCCWRHLDNWFSQTLSIALGFVVTFLQSEGLFQICRNEAGKRYPRWYFISRMCSIFRACIWAICRKLVS